jgi:helicase SWR1
MILDEAHMIKNFKSQRWMTLAVIKSFRRLLLTGTPLQNNLTELFALLQFIMSGMDFAGFKEFEGLLSGRGWKSCCIEMLTPTTSPLEKAVELGEHENEENQERVAKLHQLLRPFLLRRLKRDVEKDLPNKYEHLEFCPYPNASGSSTTSSWLDLILARTSSPETTIGSPTS